MRVVTLAPFLSDIASQLGLGAELVGVTHIFGQNSQGVSPAIVTVTPSAPNAALDVEETRLVEMLSELPVNLGALAKVAPDIILTSVSDPDPEPFCRWAEGVLQQSLGRRALVRSFTITSLEGMYTAFEEVGVAVGKGREGREFANRVKAQIMDWGDNFYPRMKNKKVTVLSSIAPLRVAGRWVPDLIKAASAQPQFAAINEADRATSWSEVASFRPDVIVVAPEGYTLEESVKTLKILEKGSEWEGIPAVKRGEVIFAEGTNLYRPGPAILRGIAVLFSAIAGLESGYITKRDEFLRLRFVELHRHRFL